jgi:hypothetical protein
VSSLWTPAGEHKVPRPDESDSTGDTGGAPADTRAAERSYPSAEEEQAIKEQLAELSQRLAAAPPEEIVANHAYGLFELAAIHLARRPPSLPAARLAIDALAALVDTLSDRLGQHAPSLRDALSQIRLAYVQIASVDAGATGTDAPTEPAPADKAEPADEGAPAKAADGGAADEMP